MAKSPDKIDWKARYDSLLYYYKACRADKDELRKALLHMARVMPTSNAYVSLHREYQDAFKIAFKALKIPWPKTRSGALTNFDRDESLNYD